MVYNMSEASFITLDVELSNFHSLAESSILPFRLMHKGGARLSSVILSW